MKERQTNSQNNQQESAQLKKTKQQLNEMKQKIKNMALILQRIQQQRTKSTKEILFFWVIFIVQIVIVVITLIGSITEAVSEEGRRPTVLIGIAVALLGSVNLIKDLQKRNQWENNKRFAEKQLMEKKNS